MRELPEIRCPECNKLVAKGVAIDMQFRCPRCKTFFTLRAVRPNEECRDRQQEFGHADCR